MQAKGRRRHRLEDHLAFVFGISQIHPRGGSCPAFFGKHFFVVRQAGHAHGDARCNIVFKACGWKNFIQRTAGLHFFTQAHTRCTHHDAIV